MEPHCHIPSDQEVGLDINNSRRRAIFLCTCTLCKCDFEIRDGKWLDTWTKKGTRIKIKICSDCYLDETESPKASAQV